MDSVSKFSNDRIASAILASDESSVSQNMDVIGLIDVALDNVLTKKSNRADSLQLLAAYSTRHTYTRLSALVDRLPTLVETLFVHDAERASFLVVIENLLGDYNTDISTQLPKILTRLMTVTCRMCLKDNVTEQSFAFSVLRILGQSKARPIMVPHTRLVRQTCINALSAVKESTLALVPLIAETYALYSSMETAEMWMTNWSEVVQECDALLSSLGVGASKSSSAQQKKALKEKNGGGNNKNSEETNKLVLLHEANLQKLRGTAKANKGMQLVKGLTSILTELLNVGCSSGFVSLNFTQFLPMWQLLLSASAELSTRDPVSYIEGDFGVSPVDLALVLSSMKADMLQVVRALLDLDHPALIRIGSALLRPVAALMTRTEGKCVPRLTEALLLCVTSAARALPSVLAASVNATPIGLLDMLTKEMDELTANQALVSQSGAQKAPEQKENKETANKDGNLSFSTGVSSTVPVNLTGAVITNTAGLMERAERAQNPRDRVAALKVLFEACEAVLLHCGPLLVPTVREAFTSIVGQGLACLAQGVISPQFADRHMHRNTGAKLRQDPAVQCLVIQLATVEVFSPPQLQHQLQQFSRNLALLKTVAELCLRGATTSAAAGRALVLLSTVLHPVTVALPAVPAVDSARGYILNVSNGTSLGAVDSGSAHVDMHIGLSSIADFAVAEVESFSPAAANHTNGTDATSPKRALDKDVTDAPSSNKRTKVETSTTPANAKAALTKAPAVASAPAPNVVNVSAQAKAIAVLAEADDDESLPDIDIDADPDSE